MGSDKVLGIWKDPLGRRIALSLACWNAHVLRKHPEMALRLNEIGSTLEKPEVIRNHRGERLYYRESPDDIGNQFQKVSVKFQPNPYKTEGFVSSAYGVKIKEEKGDVEWPKS